jgi:hypothetical protein
MRDEVTVEWGKLHKEELNDPYSSPNIWVIKSRRMIVGHVACMGERRGAYIVLVGRPEGEKKSNLEDPGLGGRIIL